MPIKVILILGLVALTVLAVALNRNRTATRVLLILLLAVGVVLIVFPELTQRAADLVGVGRGTDLLLYLLVLFVYLGSLVLVGKCRRLERQVTVAVRETALLREELERMRVSREESGKQREDAHGES